MKKINNMRQNALLKSFKMKKSPKIYELTNPKSQVGNINEILHDIKIDNVYTVVTKWPSWPSGPDHQVYEQQRY